MVETGSEAVLNASVLVTDRPSENFRSWPREHLYTDQVFIVERRCRL